MYEVLKRLMPRGLLIANETRLRRVMSWLYRGRKHRCNVCGYGLSRFIRTRDDLMCPRCGSLMRNRRLFALLQEGLLPQGTRVLDFSPSRALYRALKATTGIHYTASDFADEFVADEHFDLTKLDVADESVDLLICFHVLEHIENDADAMAEIHRVLRIGGKALIQTPFKDGDTYEDATITSPEARRRHFGQEDHVRNYSVAGLVGRLENAGLSVSVRTFTDRAENYHGFSPREVVLVAKRTDHASVTEQKTA
jgi:SAM-dependent methyltransferase